MHPSDEQLMAFADGELPAAEAEAIAALAAHNPALARRIAAFEASRTLLQRGFEQVPPPQRTLQMLREDGAAPRRGRRTPRWLPLALAASVAVVVTLALLPEARRTQASAVAGAPLGRTLQAVLEHTASGTPVEHAIDGRPAEVLVLATLRVDAGGYCRDYAVTMLDDTAPAEARAIACRDAAGVWRAHVPFGTEPAPTGEGYRLAGGASSFDGRAVHLSTAEEQALLDRGWNDPAAPPRRME